MKKKLIPILFAILILYCLFFPQRTAVSVASGLDLWYRSILPTLLPFSIFSNILVKTGMYDRMFEKMYPFTRHIYPVRAPLIYPLAAGFLFGFPLGSKICAELFSAGKITAKEAEIVCCISNNFGPAFLYNYLVLYLLSGNIHPLVIYCACYLPPLILGWFRLKMYYNRHASEYSLNRYKKPASGSHINMKTIDTGIMDGFTTMIKLAGYIILSALLAEIIQTLPFTNELIKCICIGAVEVTTGIGHIKTMDSSLLLSLLLSVAFVNFGGFSGLCQTKSMMRSVGLPLSRYICFRLLCSLTGILIVLSYYRLR